MTLRSETQQARLATFLRADHDVFETMADAIVETVVEGDREDISGAVSALEASVLTHLDGEERDLIPRYAHHDPADAAALLKEHADIRRQLTELDISTDLHLIRADALRMLLELLRAHAHHENDGLYRWAETQPEAAKSPTP